MARTKQQARKTSFKVPTRGFTYREIADYRPRSHERPKRTRDYRALQCYILRDLVSEIFANFLYENE